jgi:squalene synthase HpnC
MTPPLDFSSGKDQTRENFPVASRLIARVHRPVVLAFYKVARMADDVADHAGYPPAEKLARLDLIEASLKGESRMVPEAVQLRRELKERSLSPKHILDLLTAFRRDVTQTRYADWSELMDYCRYSASPVGRFMLDVHGELHATWPASDALCSALQVINHLQDCGEDYRTLDRVYLPMDALEGAGLDVNVLGESRASPALRGVIGDLAGRCDALLEQSRPLAGEVRDLRLALEIGVIHRLAESLVQRLHQGDPLSQSVRHRPWEAACGAFMGAASVLIARLEASAKTQTGAIGGR